ncbi:alpha/beta hydrolase [Salinispirillum sp. LH 10-3-1]|uniref:Alpha/beta hydrolase n=1 Tax=Salinispirillum sp. LH 10-3-1 TaxID=2952525 RepID=A0AB38YJV2_9GAMM
MRLLYLIALPVAGLLASCAQHTQQTEAALVNAEVTEPSGPVGYRTLEQLIFSPPDWPATLHGDLYLPELPGPHPTILLVHGGGWEARSRQDMNSTARRMARQGFAVFNVDYRFAPEFPFPAQLHDVQVAMHWLHDRAEHYQLDTDRIAAAGFSSGAHMVSLLAAVADQPTTLNTPYGGPNTRPIAVIAGGTPTDLLKFSGGRLVEQFLQGTPHEIPDVYALASPMWHLHSNAPPFFLYHGQNDRLVPIEHSTDFAHALTHFGVPHELYVMRVRGHASAFITSQRAIDQGLNFVRRVSGAAD